MRKEAVSFFLLLALGTSVTLLAAAGFIRTGSMTYARVQFPAVALPDGTVLVAGENTLERYDPAAGTFSLAGSLTTNRGSGLTATLLTDGTVLVVGGQFGVSVPTAEIYDPATGTATPTGEMSTPRSFHTATRLADGRVLITGGHSGNFPNSALDTAEVYDPATGAFTVQGQMSAARESHTATLLPDGQVLVAGGYSPSQIALTEADLFDPGTGTFIATGSMSAGRGEHTATRLGNGTILVAGGFTGFPGGALATAEVYDPAADGFVAVGNMNTPRGGHTATLLPGGSALLAGGFTSFPFSGTTLASSEIYATVSQTFVASASMHEARGRHAAAALRSGEVLVAGGMGGCCGGGGNSAELFSESVVDTTPPVITLPADITVLASSPAGATVFFTVSVVDDVDAAPTLVCEPASGSTFPVGATSVVCIATDVSGNSATGSFNVSVLPGLELTATIDPKGAVDGKTGLVTLSGTVFCSRLSNGFISGDVTQTRAKTVLHGSFSRSFRCESPSVAWIDLLSAVDGKFVAGMAQVDLTAFQCDSLGSCLSVATTRGVQLTVRQPPPSTITITKIADTTDLKPRGPDPFNGFGLPLVASGVVAFQGFAGPAQGIYTGSGGPLKVVADGKTTIPGRTDKFERFDSLAFDEVTLAFQGYQDLTSYVGLFRSRSGRLEKIADVDTPVPGGGVTFRNFVGPALSGKRAVFRGSSDFSSFSSFGVYAGDTRSLTAIADRQTPIPDGIGNFSFFGGPASIDGDTVVFSASGFDPRQEGIYSSRKGVLRKIADLNTTVPGGTSSFFFFGAPVVDQGTVAFTATDDSFKQGLYLQTGSRLKKVVDARTPIPSRSTNFGTFSDPALENGLVAFHGLDENFREAGIYTGNGDELTPVADTDTPAPGGQGRFSGFQSPALVGGNIAFLGADGTGTQGLYVQTGGTLRKIISTTDPLDGKEVGFFQFLARSECNFDCHVGFGSGLDGSHVAFLANFSAGQGIYLATFGRPFASFSAELQFAKNDFELDASFTLGKRSNGIDPVREAVSLRVGTFSTVIPAGSFRAAGEGAFCFDGEIDGTELRVTLSASRSGRYHLEVEADQADLRGTTNPVTVNLAIGDDAGGIAVTGRH